LSPSGLYQERSQIGISFRDYHLLVSRDRLRQNKPARSICTLGKLETAAILCLKRNKGADFVSSLSEQQPAQGSQPIKEQLYGVVERVTITPGFRLFRGPPFCLRSARSGDYCRRFPDIHAGQTLRLIGNYREHAQYGQQFQCFLPRTKPATLLGIEKYLGSGLIKGIGP